MLTTIVQKNRYQDSVALMVLSRALTDLEGVSKVSAMMGTPANKEILADTGFSTAELDQATPGDLVIGIDADDQAACDAVVEKADDLLRNQGHAGTAAGLTRVWSLARALTKLPTANIGLVSVPGAYAAAEARRLLAAGLNVMLFSDNVPVADEVALKREADERGLLVMGPDCGTSAFAGVPLAFGNVCARGSVGVIGASGTGTQEVMVLLDRYGAGISHAIGLGGRDLSADVGGRSALQALRVLDADPSTDVVVLVSKPPAAEVQEAVERAAQRLSKPVVTVFVGGPARPRHDGNLTHCSTLAEGARRAVELVGVRGFSCAAGGLVGLFTGGTLSDEAAVILRDELGLSSGIGTDAPGVVFQAGAHRILDLGDDVYTQGRPHPMIDPALRAELVEDVLADPATAVLLLDVVLGHGSASDPAGAIAAPIRAGLARAAAQGRDVRVVASVCGTAADEQGLVAQTDILTQAGVRVLADNAAAARHAAALVARIGAAQPSTPAPIPAGIAGLLAQPQVVNIGLSSFADDIEAIGAPVVQWSWRPPAGGDARLAHLVDRLLAS